MGLGSFFKGEWWDRGFVVGTSRFLALEWLRGPDGASEEIPPGPPSYRSQERRMPRIATTRRLEGFVYSARYAPMNDDGEPSPATDFLQALSFGRLDRLSGRFRVELQENGARERTFARFGAQIVLATPERDLVAVHVVTGEERLLARTADGLSGPPQRSTSSAPPRATLPTTTVSCPRLGGGSSLVELPWPDAFEVPLEPAQPSFGSFFGFARTLEWKLGERTLVLCERARPGVQHAARDRAYALGVITEHGDELPLLDLGEGPAGEPIDPHVVDGAFALTLPVGVDAFGDPEPATLLVDLPSASLVAKIQRGLAVLFDERGRKRWCDAL
jgi:hypothetical protein